MAAPTIVGTGATNAGTTGSVTYALPAHQANDILLLFVEAGATGGVTAPSGWAHVANSPRAQGSNVISISVMWKRATSSSETNPATASSFNHSVGFTAVVRGCVTTGDPWDITSVASLAASTALSHAVGTISVAEPLVLLIAASQTDDTANQFGTFNNTSLTGEALIQQGGTLNGNGGSLNLVAGTRTTAGSGGTFTATHAISAAWASIAIALKPYIAPPPDSPARFLAFL